MKLIILLLGLAYEFIGYFTFEKSILGRVKVYQINRYATESTQDTIFCINLKHTLRTLKSLKYIYVTAVTKTPAMFGWCFGYNGDVNIFSCRPNNGRFSHFRQ